MALLSGVFLRFLAVAFDFCAKVCSKSNVLFWAHSEPITVFIAANFYGNQLIWDLDRSWGSWLGKRLKKCTKVWNSQKGVFSGHGKGRKTAFLAIFRLKMAKNAIFRPDLRALFGGGFKIPRGRLFRGILKIPRVKLTRGIFKNSELA